MPTCFCMYGAHDPRCCMNRAEPVKLEKTKETLQSLVGRKVVAVEVAPHGVVFHLSPKDGDGGVAYWAVGAPAEAS